MVGSSRPTLEVMLLMLATTVCVVIIMATTAVLLVEVVRPETDSGPALRAIGSILQLWIAVLAGVLAGRRYGNGKNGNGSSPPPTRQPPE